MSAFIIQSGLPKKPISFIYVISIPAYYYFFILVLTLLISPIFKIRYLKYIIIIPKIILDLFLLYDILVFNTYRFHIDMILIKMTINDFKGIGFSPAIIIAALLSFLGISIINVFIFKVALKKKKYKVWRINAVLFMLLISGQMIHIWANEFNQEFIKKYTPYFPYYFPTTSSHLMSTLKNKYPFLVPNPIEKTNGNISDILKKEDSENSILNYPKHPLNLLDSISGGSNILLFVLESWRADMVNSKVTPNIDSFSKKSYFLKNHFSGGNVTVSGLFTLMYGLHPSYLKYFQAKPLDYQTELIKSLERNNYEIKAYTSSNLDRFALKAMFFNQIVENNYINYMEGSPEKNDREVVNKLKQDILNDESSKPWFKFVFLTSSHHHYNYPEEHKIFKPIPANNEGFLFDKDIDPTPYLNDYKNSLHYEDALFGEILEATIKSKQSNNTVIIITSDHGEEFNDNHAGYWGHGSNYTEFQTHVPLIIHLPGQSTQTELNYRSGHIDIAPTIMKSILRCKNPISDFSSGVDLFNLNEDSNLIISSYNSKAYLINNFIYSTGLFVESYDVNNIKKKNQNFEFQRINDLRKKEREFLK